MTDGKEVGQSRMLRDTKEGTWESETFLVFQPWESLNGCNGSSIKRNKSKGLLLEPDLSICSRDRHCATEDTSQGFPHKHSLGSPDLSLKPGDNLPRKQPNQHKGRAQAYAISQPLHFCGLPLPPPYAVPWGSLGVSVLLKF